MTILCVSTEICPKSIAVDWTNENRLYGLNGSDCLVSNDKGNTWSVCGPRPWTLALKKINLAVSKSGSLLVLSNDSSGFNIYRSVTGGLTWSIVFSSTTLSDTPNVVQGRVHCSRTNTTCIAIVNGSVSTNKVVLVSNDEGVTWTQTNVYTLTSSSSRVFSVDEDLFTGIDVPFTPDGTSASKAILFNGTVSSLSSVWSSSPYGCTSLILDGNRRAICRTLNERIIEIRDENGVLLNSATIDIGMSNNFMAVGVRSHGIWMIGKSIDERMLMWISLDSGFSFSVLDTGLILNDRMSVIGTIVNGLDGCVYASWNNFINTGTAIKLC